MATPFLKWAGGKSKHLPVIDGILDDAGIKRVGAYCEPFIGGGAVFFALQASGSFERAIIGDANVELVRCYQGVRADPEGVVAGLMRFASPWNERNYQMVRAEHEEHLELSAARTIYLNKAGFNGLYRVNKNGCFNVPWGKHKKAPAWSALDFDECSDALNDHVKIVCGDFEKTLTLLPKGKRSLAYLDPPYVPVSKTSNFTGYTAGGFSMGEQERVAEAFDELAKRKNVALLSQADVPWVRERFRNYDFVEVQARRNINSKGDKRGPVGEVIVCANL